MASRCFRHTRNPKTTTASTSAYVLDVMCLILLLAVTRAQSRTVLAVTRAHSRTVPAVTRAHSRTVLAVTRAHSRTVLAVTRAHSRTVLAVTRVHSRTVLAVSSTLLMDNLEKKPHLVLGKGFALGR
jgi:hypothetical protein